MRRTDTTGVNALFCVEIMTSHNALVIARPSLTEGKSYGVQLGCQTALQSVPTLSQDEWNHHSMTLLRPWHRSWCRERDTVDRT